MVGRVYDEMAYYLLLEDQSVDWRMAARLAVQPAVATLVVVVVFAAAQFGW